MENSNPEQISHMEKDTFIYKYSQEMNKLNSIIQNIQSMEIINVSESHIKLYNQQSTSLKYFSSVVESFTQQIQTAIQNIEGISKNDDIQCKQVNNSINTGNSLNEKSLDHDLDSTQDKSSQNICPQSNNSAQTLFPNKIQAILEAYHESETKNQTSTAVKTPQKSFTKFNNSKSLKGLSNNNSSRQKQQINKQKSDNDSEQDKNLGNTVVDDYDNINTNNSTNDSNQSDKITDNTIEEEENIRENNSSNSLMAQKTSKEKRGKINIIKPIIHRNNSDQQIQREKKKFKAQIKSEEEKYQNHLMEQQEQEQKQQLIKVEKQSQKKETKKQKQQQQVQQQQIIEKMEYREDEDNNQILDISQINLNDRKLLKGRPSNYNIYTQEQKLEALHKLKTEYHNNFSLASKVMQIPSKNLRRWHKDGAERKQGGGRKTLDPVMEERLHEWIKAQSTLDNLKKKLLNRRDIMQMAQNLSTYPDRFKASKGWLDKFLRRYNLKAHIQKCKLLVAQSVSQQEVNQNQENMDKYSNYSNSIQESDDLQTDSFSQNDDQEIKQEEIEEEDDEEQIEQKLIKTSNQDSEIQIKIENE